MKKATTIILQILALVVLLQGLVVAQTKRTFIDFTFDKLFQTTLLTPTPTSVGGISIEYDNSISEPNTKFEGYLSFGDNGSLDPRPGILLFPGVGGITPAIKAKADQLAKSRYMVFVVDLFGKGAKTGANEIAALKAKPTLARERIAAALVVLKNQSKSDAARLTAMGFDEGGHFALEAARAGLPLLLVAAVDPTDLSTTMKATKDSIKASILVIHAQNPQIRQQVADLTNEMSAVNTDLVTVNIGAPPGFTKAGGEAFNATANVQTNKLLDTFFNEQFLIKYAK